MLALAASLVLLVALGFGAASVNEYLSRTPAQVALAAIEAAPDAASDPRGVKWSFTQGAPAMYDLMRAKGDRTPELWATEAGASTCTNQNNVRCVSRERQAQFVTAYLRGAEQFPYLRSMVIYQLRDNGNDRSDVESQFGLVSRGMSPKPSLNAFRAARRG